MNASGGESGARQHVGADTTLNAADGGTGGAVRVTVKDVLSATCTACDASPVAVSGGLRVPELVRVRHLAWMIAADWFGLTYSEIGRKFYRPPGTVLRGAEVARRKLAKDRNGHALVVSIVKSAKALSAARIAAAAAGEGAGPQPGGEPLE